MGNKILVTRSSMPPYSEYIEEIRSMWDSHWLTNMGEKHEKLKDLLRDYLGVENIELFTNGHMSIEIALEALGVEGEVITTPFTFASTTHAIVRRGLTPVFCDVDRNTYTIDTDRIESLITERTGAILPVHVYGNICDVEKLEAIAEKHGLKLLYDAAHAFGVKYKGRGIASYGDASVFSFHATKVFNTIEGGAICFGNGMDPFGEDIYLLKDFGISKEDEVKKAGLNAKLNEFCAAMGICNLRHLDEEIEKRKKVYEVYYEELSSVEGLTLCGIKKDLTPNYAYFPVLFDKESCGLSRDEALDLLRDRNIFARKYFYPLTSEFECYKGRFDPGDTPVALELSRKVLTLPFYADLSYEDVKMICSIIKKGCGR